MTSRLDELDSGAGELVTRQPAAPERGRSLAILAAQVLVGAGFLGF